MICFNKNIRVLDRTTKNYFFPFSTRSPCFCFHFAFFHVSYHLHMTFTPLGIYVLFPFSLSIIFFHSPTYAFAYVSLFHFVFIIFPSCISIQINVASLVAAIIQRMVSVHLFSIYISTSSIFSNL